MPRELGLAQKLSDDQKKEATEKNDQAYNNKVTEVFTTKKGCKYVGCSKYAVVKNGAAEEYCSTHKQTVERQHERRSLSPLKEANKEATRKLKKAQEFQKKKGKLEAEKDAIKDSAKALGKKVGCL
jgi:hypothetical protein